MESSHVAATSSEPPHSPGMCGFSACNWSISLPFGDCHDPTPPYQNSLPPVRKHSNLEHQESTRGFDCWSMAVSFAFDFVCCMFSQHLLHKNRIATICVSISKIANHIVMVVSRWLWIANLGPEKILKNCKLHFNSGVKVDFKNKFSILYGFKES